MVEEVDAGDEAQAEEAGHEGDEEGDQLENEFRREDLPDHEVAPVDARARHAPEQLKRNTDL